MSVIIRKAGVADFPAIYALLREFSLFQKTPEKMVITLEEMLEDQHLFQGLVAEEAGAIAGFATFFFSYYSWTGKAIYLDDLYVREDRRGQGTGKQLLDAVIRLAREERCKKVRWLVSKWNAPAIAFYTKMGAVIEDTEMTSDFVLGSPRNG
jgi:GNAT superfamily N-acetyltransferase